MNKMDKRFETLKEKYNLPRKKTKRIICENCMGGEAYQTYPKSECAECNGLGYIVEDVGDKDV